MDCSALTIANVLSDSHKVPGYQRPYAWKKEHVKSFFDDLEGFVNRDGGKPEEYHFGQIIVHKESSNEGRGAGPVYNIVDGQQRLITSTIFLCAMRDIIRERQIDDDDLKSRINTCIGFDNENGFNLTVGTLNQAFFRAYVQCKDHSKRPDHPSNKLIKEAYTILKDKINEFIGDEDPRENLWKLSNGFLKNFKVTHVVTDDVTQAYTMFEKLNSRGMKLETSDLLKNFLFSKIDKPGYQVKDIWSDLMNSIAKEGCDESMFIRYHWNSTHKYASKDKVFDEISKMKNPDEICAYFDDLVSCKDSYLDVMKPKKSKDSDLNDHLITLKDLSAKSFCPLWMALNRNEKTSKDDKVKVLKHTEALFIRNFTICKESTSGIDKMFASLAFEFSKGDRDIDYIVRQIDKKIVSDETVKNKFSTLECNAKRGRMILTKMYDEEMNELKIGPKKVHLEHIMPQDKGNWDISDEDHKKYVNRLGNLMLLDKRINESASNSLFEKKVEYYRGTRIEDNESVLNKSTWGPKQIENRQKELCDKFIKIWPQPPKN